MQRLFQEAWAVGSSANRSNIDVVIADIEIISGARDTALISHGDVGSPSEW